MAWPLSQAGAYALTARVQQIRTRVDVTNGGAVLATLVPQQGSTVTEDETVTSRRTASFNFTTTISPATTLVPSQPTDLLHPASGNELVAYNGIWVPSEQTWEWAPMGVFQLSQPVVSEAGSSSSGDTVSLTITCQDRSSAITRRGWVGPWTGGAGLRVDQAIQAGLNDRWGPTQPPLVFNFQPATVIVPYFTALGITYTATGSSSVGGSGSSSVNDPFADFVAWAVSAGMELFFYRDGSVILRPVPQPGSLPPVISFVEGDGNTAVTMGKAMDATDLCNGVPVIGTGGVITSPILDATNEQALYYLMGNGAIPAGFSAPTSGNPNPRVLDPKTGTVVYQWTGVGAAVLTGGYVAVTDPDAIGGAAHQPPLYTNTNDVAGYAAVGVIPGQWERYRRPLYTNSGDFPTLPAAFGSAIMVPFTQSTPAAPTYAIAWDENPASPGYWLGPFGACPADAVIDPTCVTAGDCYVSAVNRLALAESVAETVSLTCTSNFTLDAGDTCVVTRTPLRIQNASYIMSQIVTPLGVASSGGGMSIANRPASVQVFNFTPVGP